MFGKRRTKFYSRPEAPAGALPKKIPTAADKARVAGEALQDPSVQRLLTEAEAAQAALDRELDLEADAIQYLSNAAADKQAFLNAGLPEKMIANKDSLGRMAGNVPMPIMNTSGNIRTHVKYETNPVT